MRDCFVLFLIGTEKNLFEPKMYIKKMYAFPLVEFMGKQLGRSVDIIPFSSLNVILFTPI